MVKKITKKQMEQNALNTYNDIKKELDGWSLSLAPSVEFKLLDEINEIKIHYLNEREKTDIKKIIKIYLSKIIMIEAFRDQISGKNDIHIEINKMLNIINENYEKINKYCMGKNA